MSSNYHILCSSNILKVIVFLAVILIIYTIINSFAFQHFVFEGKNESFFLENALNLTHEFCMIILQENFVKFSRVSNLMHNNVLTDKKNNDIRYN